MLDAMAQHFRVAPGRQQLDGRPLLAQADVRVGVHRQSDVAVPGQGLGCTGRHTDVLQVGDECVPVGVEIGEPAGAVLVSQEIRRLAFGLLLAGFDLLDPLLPGGLEIGLHHF